jgi:HSP20 family protein
MQCDFGRMAGRRPRGDNAAGSTADWRPAVDIVEEKTRFVLRADLPGVDRDAIDVSMEDGFLTITGERASEDRSDVDGIERYERVTGRFYRRFSLPEAADADGIKARIRNGILEIEIPKLPEVRPRRIDIEAA